MENKKKTPTLKLHANMLEIGTIYSITINPDQQHQFYGDPDRFKKTHKYWSKCFQRYEWEYLLYPEISSPHDSLKLPRIHYHGLVCFRNVNQLLSWYSCIHYDLAKFSYFDMDIWDGRSTYILYSKKNEKLMSKFCKMYKMDYELESLTIKLHMQKHIDSLSKSEGHI